ncbi:MAG: hypothetical protein IJV64_08435 [Oscillospiraceae bacterium]|nr:hypothetical protein [Oscillospiraceae bacterium]
MLGPVIGAAMTINSAKKNPVDIYGYRDVASVRTGKYAGLMSTLVLELRNGKAVSFVPAGKSAQVSEQVFGLIAQYLRYGKICQRGCKCYLKEKVNG